MTHGAVALARRWPGAPDLVGALAFGVLMVLLWRAMRRHPAPAKTN